MNQKVSILTCSRSNSFGANLQCYALSHTLRKMGFDVELLNLKIHISIGARIRSWLMGRDKFRNESLPPFSKLYKSAAELCATPPTADYFIVGSDQVWNPQITNSKFANNYFLDFAPPSAKRISYAASYGTAQWNGSVEAGKAAGELLKKFDAISVREESGLAITQTLAGCDAEVVCDPTLLVDDYTPIMGRPEAMTNNLVLFSLSSKLINFSTLREYASREGLNPVTLTNSRAKGFEVRSFASIQTWLRTMQSAKIIFTDSFHGVMFALIFNKQFVAIDHGSPRFERIRSLLQRMGLERLILKQCDIMTDMAHREAIDYDHINTIIKQERQKGLDFLIGNLKK